MGSVKKTKRVFGRLINVGSREIHLIKPSRNPCIKITIGHLLIILIDKCHWFFVTIPDSQISYIFAPKLAPDEQLNNDLKLPNW